MASLRSVISSLDANLPMEQLRTMELQVHENILLERVMSTLSAAFALLATLLAAVGLYGVVAYSVTQKTREIGLRIALGADAGRVRGMILGQVSWMAIPGALLGMVGALGLGRLAGSLLFELQGHDPAVFAGAALVLMGVAFSAGFVPARRAARIDPMEALREE